MKRRAVNQDAGINGARPDRVNSEEATRQHSRPGALGELLPTAGRDQQGSDRRSEQDTVANCEDRKRDDRDSAHMAEAVGSMQAEVGLRQDDDRKECDDPAKRDSSRYRATVPQLHES